MWASSTDTVDMGSTFLVEKQSEVQAQQLLQTPIFILILGIKKAWSSST